MLKTGLVSATFKKKDPSAVLDLAVRAKLEGIEWSEHHHLEPDDIETAQTLGEATRARGLSVAAYGSYYRVGCESDPRQAFAPRLASARALGAPLIRIWAGNLPSRNVGDTLFASLVAETRLLVSMAADAGLFVAFEWHRKTLTDTNASALHLAKAVDDDRLRFLWQPTPALNEEERVEGLLLLDGRLANLHVYHWVDGKRRPLAEGRESWKRYFDAASPGDRYALLEFVMLDTEEQFLEDAATLRSWVRHYR